MLKRILTIFSLIIILTSCSLLGEGSNTIIKQSANERRDKKAILFLRKAGATVSDSYQVTVMSFTDKFDTTKVGNAFTVDNNHGKTWLNSETINFTWRSNDTLQIDFDKKVRTFIQRERVSDVSIIYKAK